MLTGTSLIRNELFFEDKKNRPEMIRQNVYSFQELKCCHELSSSMGMRKPVTSAETCNQFDVIILQSWKLFTEENKNTQMRLRWY